MKRYFLLAALTACSSGWKYKQPAEPEPDSRTEYDHTPVTPEPVAENKRSCAVPNATTANVSVVVTNTSAFVHDLCVATDQSLGLLPALTGFGGFEIDVALKELGQSGVHVKCSVSIAVRATGGAVIGVFSQVVTGRASSAKPPDVESSKRDCVDANIDDLLRQRAVPAMKRHAAVSSP